jgi:hemerythrin superfamily protein
LSVKQQEQEFMDATELLKKDHDAVRQLFAEFESAESEQDKLDAYDDIREQLLIHARIEEEIFYPAVREANSGRSATQVDQALSEHQQVKAMLNRPTLKGKCFTPKDGKWQSLSETSEVKRWRATIFA